MPIGSAKFTAYIVPSNANVFNVRFTVYIVKGTNHVPQDTPTTRYCGHPSAGGSGSRADPEDSRRGFGNDL